MAMLGSVRYGEVSLVRYVEVSLGYVRLGIVKLG